MQETAVAPWDFDDFLRAERDRVVHFCARLSGSLDFAEDLAQETMLEAWRSRERLRDADVRVFWLFGIARNVCRRWHRRQRSYGMTEAYSLTFEDFELQIADDVEIELALERSEIADLLDHAMGRLSARSRAVLVERYIEDLPVGEIAARHGITDGAASLRLHRGAAALKEVLLTDLRVDAVALGIIDPASDYWSGTRIWCPYCGAGRLLAQRDDAGASFIVQCRQCGYRTEERACTVLRTVRGHWRTLLRVNRAADCYYRDAILTGEAICACCGRCSPLRRSLPLEIAGEKRDASGVHIRCDGCGALSFQPDIGIAFTHPSVQRLWRRHKRIRFAGRRELAYMDRDAVSFQFEAVSDTATVDILLATDTFEILYAGND